MDNTAIPRQNPETAARVIDEALYILHAETSDLHALNDVGARIWELTDGERTVAAVASVIESEYDVDQAQAEADVIAFLDELLEKGLVLLA